MAHEMESERQPCACVLAGRRHGTLDVGVTSNLLARVAQHRQGLIPGFTRDYGVRRLVWFERHETMLAAIARGKQLKEWRGAWKIQLIETTNPIWVDMASAPGLASLTAWSMGPGFRRDDGEAVTDPRPAQPDAIARIAAAPDLAALEAVRVRLLGKSGEVTALLKTLGAMTADERQVAGPRIHGLREAVTAALAARKAALEAAQLEARLASETLDLSLPVAPPPPGSIHPVSQVMDELAEIFADLGFAVATGPEIEDDWHNFTALNIPESHPARAMHDTFYVDRADGEGADAGKRMLLRTHTSPVQIRTMLASPPPLRVIAPGRVYRSDSDATHTPMFHQVEGLVIDADVHLGQLKWTLETFVRAFFERDDIVLRFRPSYFPFTEPSMEVDVGYTLRGGRRVVGGAAPDGWMEVLGAGMVHRTVLAACGLDATRWQGFAFGCGIDRLAMLKYGMDDLRAFFDGDLRWLRHYGFAALDVPTLSGGVGA